MFHLDIDVNEIEKTREGATNCIDRFKLHIIRVFY